MTIGLIGLSTDHGRREIGDERTSAVNRRTWLENSWQASERLVDRGIYQNMDSAINTYEEPEPNARTAW